MSKAKNNKVKLNNIVDVVADYGADPTGVADSTTAIQAAITYCKQQVGGYFVGELYLPAGLYSVSATLDFGSLKVRGAGVNETCIKTGTSGILIAKMSAMGVLADISIDGNNLALWGLLVAGARPVIDNVVVVKCTEYGTILSSTQNGIFKNLLCYQNHIGLVMANGTRNCNFYNFTSSGAAQSAALTTSANIAWLTDITNPHGFGLTTTVTAGGNDRNNFFGGISETNNTIQLYAMVTLNPNSWVGANAAINTFYGYELTSGNSILLTDNSFTGVFYFINAEWIGKDNLTPLTSGTAGSLVFIGSTYFLSGGTLPNRGVTQNNNLISTFVKKTNLIGIPQSNVDYLLVNSASLVYTQATRTYKVTGASGTADGLRIILNGYDGYTAVSIVAMAPILRVTFSVKNFVGGTQIDVVALNNGSSFGTVIGSPIAGAYQYLYKCTGVESGDIVFYCKGATTSFEISDVVIEVL
jgi:hypothetical protein